MALESDNQHVDTVVRSLSTASKSLRLYPSSSPIPRQTVEAAASSLDSFFSERGAPVLVLDVVRDGLECHGCPVGGAGGGAELADRLRDLGAAELSILAGCSSDELLGFLDIVNRDPEQLRAGGGLCASLAAAGIEAIRATDVHLTVVEQIAPSPEQDVDEFLRQLIEDPAKLSAWFASAAAGDPRTFEEGLMELVRVSGPSGYQVLLESLGGAFMSQASDARDALLGLALNEGPTRDVTGGMFSYLKSGDIAASVLEGSLGRNMLSLSAALTHLPLENVTAQVRAEVQAMLPQAGHTQKEARFLEHMLEVRQSPEKEPALVESDATYSAVVEASRLSEETISAARGNVASSMPALTAASVQTMLALLDQQEDFELYCGGADALAGMVPRLIGQGDLDLALHALTQLSARQSDRSGPWPELSERMRAAVSRAVDAQSMGALVRAVAADSSLASTARKLVRVAGDAAPAALLAEAVALKAPGIKVAEELLGRSVVDQLHRFAPQAQWFQLAPICARLADEGDPRSIAALEALLNRQDDQSRREVVNGVATSAGPAAGRLLVAALSDPSAEVAIVAARAIARRGGPGAVNALAARLSQIDADGADFLMAREIIAAITRIPGDEADQVLSRLASRRSLMKRGHFAEVQELVRQARLTRAEGGRSL